MDNPISSPKITLFLLLIFLLPIFSPLATVDAEGTIETQLSSQDGIIKADGSVQTRGNVTLTLTVMTQSNTFIYEILIFWNCEWLWKLYNSPANITILQNSGSVNFWYRSLYKWK